MNLVSKSAECEARCSFINIDRATMNESVVRMRYVSEVVSKRNHSFVCDGLLVIWQLRKRKPVGVNSLELHHMISL
ncbi:hypothetical protein [Rhodopseudomonas palustris]|uniref:hypothetical protein n=1 Tax=Rhodopseudomonas palustris TaxID=1076 RepID=UPI0012ED0A3C|nr:hypothetical protein [Rhodopseudomonas palustris]